MGRGLSDPIRNLAERIPTAHSECPWLIPGNAARQTINSGSTTPGLTTRRCRI